MSMPFLMVLFVAVVIAVLVVFIRWLTGPRQAETGVLPAPNRPLDILRERFARGEIDKDEFEQRRNALGV
jgi:putative membrane protein